MIKILKRIFNWIKAFFSKKKERFKLISSEDLPDKKEIKEHIVYIIGDDGFEWCLVFQCPCGCKSVIYLNLLTDTRPCWKIEKLDKKSFSISPSINRVVGCKSHFFLKKNEIEWV